MSMIEFLQEIREAGEEAQKRSKKQEEARSRKSGKRKRV